MTYSRSRHNWLMQCLMIGTTIAMGGTAYYSYQAIYHLTLESLKQNAFLTTQMGAKEIDSWLSTLKVNTETLANTDIVRTMDWPATEPYLKTEIARFPEGQTIAVGNQSGWRNAVGAKPTNIKDRLYFQKAIAGMTNVSDPLISRALHIPSIMIAAPIRPNAGTATQPIGEIHRIVNLDRVAQVINQIKYGSNSYAFALSSAGKAIVHPNKTWISTLEQPAPSLVQASDPVLADIAQRMINHQQGIELVKLDGTWQYIAYLPLREAEWSIALVIPRENVELPLQALNLLAALIAGLLLMLIGFLLQMKSFQQRHLYLSNQALENRVADRTAELAITLQQLQQSQTQLQQVNEALEQRVTARTAELSIALEELQRSQVQLIQSEKMSSLGQLVAGVAHEINNPVSFIHGNLAYANRYVQDLIHLIQLYQEHVVTPSAEIHQAADAIDLEFVLEDLPKLFTSMEIGANRIKDIVLSLRLFSRMDESDIKAVDIHEGMDSALVILGHRLKETAHRPALQVIKAYGSLPLVECYAGQLNQVFMNILSNAIDALEEMQVQQKNHIGQITIQTSVIDANWVKIEISDNGVGISEAVKHNIFNPFFTTKPIGKGTGMGLGISYQIIIGNHGGHIDCGSILGQGTQFTLQIPLVLSRKIEITLETCYRLGQKLPATT